MDLVTINKQIQPDYSWKGWEYFREGIYRCMHMIAGYCPVIHLPE